ncbi:MAG: ABC transporter permease, partial [Chloroflexota bacterium]|nr:ABC transporter permease [Chloroflexota bacterium]
MFLLMVRRALSRAWPKKALAALAVALGTSLAAGMLNVVLDVGDSLDRELKSYGANIVVTPAADAGPLQAAGAGFAPPAAQSYLPEKDVPLIKTIFWRNNIVGFAPELEAQAEVPGAATVPVVGTWFRKSLIIATGETVSAGVQDIKPWWQVTGTWPDDQRAGASALVGQEVARRLSLKPGDKL